MSCAKVRPCYNIEFENIGLTVRVSSTSKSILQKISDFFPSMHLFCNILLLALGCVVISRLVVCMESQGVGVRYHIICE